MSTSARPAFRSGALPACHLARNWLKVSSTAVPTAVAGMVELPGFLKMSRKTLNCGSAFSSVAAAIASVVVGTFLMPMASFATALGSVVRYLVRAQAASGFLADLVTPMMFPVTYPAP